MAELYADVNGQMAPLRACTWVFSHSCGHPFAVLLADLPGFPDATYPTEEQAWRVEYPRARDRKAAQRRGVQLRLATHASLGDEFWQQMKDGCECTPGVNHRG